jgi:hypothetical protein
MRSTRMRPKRRGVVPSGTATATGCSRVDRVEPTRPRSRATRAACVTFRPPAASETAHAMSPRGAAENPSVGSPSGPTERDLGLRPRRSRPALYVTRRLPGTRTPRLRETATPPGRSAPRRSGIEGGRVSADLRLAGALRGVRLGSAPSASHGSSRSRGRITGIQSWTGTTSSAGM